MYFLNSADVELTSIAENQPTNRMAKKVLKKGLPRLLDLYSKYEDFTYKFSSELQRDFDEQNNHFILAFSSRLKVKGKKI